MAATSESWMVFRKGVLVGRVPMTVAKDKVDAMKLVARYAMKKFVASWYTAAKFKTTKR
jgi:hypothetical protein